MSEYNLDLQYNDITYGENEISFQGFLYIYQLWFLPMQFYRSSFFDCQFNSCNFSSNINPKNGLLINVKWQK
jgi:hypothetical protein